MQSEKWRVSRFKSLPLRGAAFIMIICVFCSVFEPILLELKNPRLSSNVSSITAISIKSRNLFDSPPFPIDVVFTWVDGADPKWMDNFIKWSQLDKVRFTKTNTKLRYESLDEIKYSIRSVEQNIGWFNKIFIVTANQHPDWINLSHPRLVLVSHSDIFPDINISLPNFNSYGIESVIHRIPDLSEHYIYFNDDMFIGQPLSYNFFFKEDGTPKMLYNGKNWTERTMTDLVRKKRALRNDMNGIQFEFVKMGTTKLIAEHFKNEQYGEYAHSPVSLTKTLMNKIEETFPEMMNNTRSTKFRNSENMMMQQAALLFGKESNTLIPVEAANFTKFIIVNRKSRAYVLPNRTADLPMIFCVNTDSILYMPNVKRWFEAVFPYNSSFELGSYQAEPVFMNHKFELVNITNANVTMDLKISKKPIRKDFNQRFPFMTPTFDPYPTYRPARSNERIMIYATPTPQFMFSKGKEPDKSMNELIPSKVERTPKPIDGSLRSNRMEGKVYNQKRGGDKFRGRTLVSPLYTNKITQINERFMKKPSHTPRNTLNIVKIDNYYKDIKTIYEIQRTPSPTYSGNIIMENGKKYYRRQTDDALQERPIVIPYPTANNLKPSDRMIIHSRQVHRTAPSHTNEDIEKKFIRKTPSPSKNSHPSATMHPTFSPEPTKM